QVRLNTYVACYGVLRVAIVSFGRGGMCIARMATGRGRPMSKQVRGVILDIDGTLINSHDAHARAWVDALHEVDIQVTFADVRPLIGMGGDKLLPAIANIEESSR